MKSLLKGMAAVVFGGMGCFAGVVIAIVLAVAVVAAALGNALPQPLQGLFWAWLVGKVPAQSDVELPDILSVGTWYIPYEGYKGPKSFVCAVPAQGPGVDLTDCFGSPRKWGYHHGMDFGAPEGTPVIAPMGGKVVYAAFSPVGYGNLVVIENDGYQVLLAHNKAFAVHVGDIVEAGQVVAYSGDTGISTGPHLHFEIRRVDEQGGVSIDPPKATLPGQTEFCDWYRLAPPNNWETKGCQNAH